MTNSNIVHLLDFENPIFASFIFWSCILLLKTLLMSVFTTFYRSKNKAHISPEDVAFVKKFDTAERKVSHSDKDVERVRSAHLNDLENILPFLFAAFFYLLTDPAEKFACRLFQVAAISRIIHTIVYTIVIVPQPTRGISWATHYLITIYMIVSTLCYVCDR